MKILMILNAMNIGGAETHVLEIAFELKRRGNEIDIASSGGSYTKELEAHGIRHFTLPLNNRGPVSIIKSYHGLKKLIGSERYDIVHAHARIPAFICGRLRHRLDFRYVSTAHGVYTMNYFWRVLTDWGEKSLAVSSDIKTYLIDEYGILPEKISITINGIDTEKFSSDVNTEYARELTDLPEDTIKLLHVSRIDPDSSVPSMALCDVASEVYAKNNRFRLIIVGGGSDFPALEAKAKAVNKKCAEKVITLCGAQTNIASFMADCDIFAGVSRAALEAMAASKPVILGGNGGYIGILDEKCLSEAIDSNFTCRDSGKLKQSVLCSDIIKLLEATPEQRAEMGSFNRKVILERYSVGRMADDYERVYRTLTPFKSKKYPDILINGYYGYQNHGDDALLRMIISLLKRNDPEVQIAVLSAHPKRARYDYNVRGIYRYNIFKIRHILPKVKLLISGGGSLLQDATSTKSLYYYSYIMRLAHRTGARLMVYANGLGPLNSKKNVEIAARALTDADAITLRDRESLEFFRSLNTGRVASLTGDPALCYQPCDDSEARRLIEKIGLTNQKYFIVALRHGKNPHLVENIIDYCNLMAREKGIVPLFVCMQKKLDRAITENMLAGCPEGKILPGNIDIEDILGVFSHSEFILGMRLHSLIYAATVRKPMIGIRYDPKVSSFLSSVGFGEFAVSEQVSIEELFEKTEVILADTERKQNLEKTVDELCLLAEDDAKTAIKLTTQQ